MVAFTLALAAAAPLVLAVEEEKSWLHFPTPEEVRVQTIARQSGEAEWPFSAEQGFLTCIPIMGQRHVYFVGKDARGNVSQTVDISADPFEFGFANWGKMKLFAPTGGLAELMRRVGPFVAAGNRLCDQPPGTHVGPGEL